MNPTISFLIDDPGGTINLGNLAANLPSLQAAQIPAFALSGSGISESWSPTVTTYSLLVTLDVMNFVGFKPPIANPPSVNSVKAGSAVPVKWQLTDANGGFISDLSAITSVQFNQSVCQGAGTKVNNVTAQGSGTSGLRYDPIANQFIYNWKTAKTMAGKCYTLVLTLNDGSKYNAYFAVK